MEVNYVTCLQTLGGYQCLLCGNEDHCTSHKQHCRFSGYVVLAGFEKYSCF